MKNTITRCASAFGYLVALFCLIHSDIGSGPAFADIMVGKIRAKAVLVVDDLVAPVLLTHANDGTDRLFVVDQAGEIGLIRNGSLLTTAYLDASALIVSPLGGIIPPFQEPFGDFSNAGFFTPGGRLFYGDLTTGEILEFDLGCQLGLYVKGFGQDANGELYVMGGTNLGPFRDASGRGFGSVHRLSPRPGLLDD